MLQSDTVSRKIFNVVNTCLLALIAVVSLYPIIYCLFISISNSDLVMTHRGLVWKPLGFSLAAYKEVFTNRNIGTGYLNTLFIVIVGTSLNMIFTSIAAYVLSRKNVVINKALMMLIVLTMYINGGMVPNFLLIKDIGLYNKLGALIIPGLISAYNLIILRNGFMGIPDSLSESAEIDGAGPFRILVNVILPLSKASLAVVTLYYAVTHWNSWFNAMIYLKDSGKFPLQLVLRQILIVNSGASMTDDMNTSGEKIAETIQYAVIMVATVPILCFYPFIQKYFAKGVMLGAVKG